MKRLLRIIFKKIALQLAGTGIGKNKLVFNVAEFVKKKLKEDFILIDGCKLLLDETDRHAFTIYGEEDPKERELIKKIIRNGDVVIDVGANIGIHTVVMAKYVGKTGHVFAFEPSPYNVKLLKNTVSLNGFQNVTVIDNAVSDKPGKGSFYFSKGISAHSLSDFGYNKGAIEVNIESIDHFCEKLNKKIDFLKIDAEGYDFKVLKGMENILRNSNPKFLIEFFPERIKKSGDSPEEFLRFLFKEGFSVKNLSDGKQLALSDIDTVVRFYDSPPPNHMTNFYCERMTT
jgi:FkbM family methyltransferase